ncbi:unnamed protein product [Pleuronectes platessa]|uniref:Uncharacterized protein n=1 Tax=Pleuronectes platessa TaxID=8262 RepID=A0A9N7YLE0_PLEPL|nr:unnamed protein product [Pleuronectes platessa]
MKSLLFQLRELSGGGGGGGGGRVIRSHFILTEVMMEALGITLHHHHFSGSVEYEMQNKNPDVPPVQLQENNRNPDSTGAFSSSSPFSILPPPSIPHPLVSSATLGRQCPLLIDGSVRS